MLKTALTPQAKHHFTRFDQVDQLVGASEADADLGFMARMMALCSLPRSNPGNRKEYKRVNGPFTLYMVRGCQRPSVLHVGPGDVRLVHAPSPIASHPGIVVPVSVKSERYVIHSRQTAGFQGADPRGFNWDRKRQSIVGSRPAINHASDRSAGSGLDDNSDNGPKSDRLAPRGPGDDRRGLVISGDRQTARYECPAAASNDPNGGSEHDCWVYPESLEHDRDRALFGDDLRPTSSDAPPAAALDPDPQTPPVAGWTPRQLDQGWGAVLEGAQVADLPASDQLRGTPIRVTDRRGDTWTTTLTDVVSRRDIEIVVTTSGRPRSR